MDNKFWIFNPNNTLFEEGFEMSEPMPKKQMLKDKNFKVVSTNWIEVMIRGRLMKVNPEGDIWEFTDGEYKGEQLFTYDAAERETKIAREVIPDKDLFHELLKKDELYKRMPFAGYRHYTDGSLSTQGTHGYYWASTISGTNANYLYFNSSAVYPASTSNRAYGFAVRCLKD